MLLFLMSLVVTKPNRFNCKFMNVRANVGGLFNDDENDKSSYNLIRLFINNNLIIQMTLNAEYIMNISIKKKLYIAYLHFNVTFKVKVGPKCLLGSVMFVFSYFH